MKIKNLNGFISFKFNLEDSTQKKIYLDLVNKKAPVREYIITEILKKHYFESSSDTVNSLEDRLLDILDNLSVSSIQKKVVQIQSSPSQEPNPISEIKKDNLKLNLAHIGQTKKDEPKKYDDMLEKVYTNSFVE